MHIGVNPRLEKGGAPLPGAPPGQWFHVRQDKHHRWSLDERQIYQYHLGGALHPHIRWWEAIDVPRRSVQVVEVGEGITIVSLVCEDLAQNDDVAELIRSIGPTIVSTALLDGPQLTSRWSARYASVLADDPGSAVMTLTSFGMAQRSKPAGYRRFIGDRAVEGPRPGDPRDLARAGRTGRAPDHLRRSRDQAECRRPLASRFRDPLLRCRRPPDPGLGRT